MVKRRLAETVKGPKKRHTLKSSVISATSSEHFTGDLDKTCGMISPDATSVASSPTPSASSKSPCGQQVSKIAKYKRPSPTGASRNSSKLAGDDEITRTPDQTLPITSNDTSRVQQICEQDRRNTFGVMSPAPSLPATSDPSTAMVPEASSGFPFFSDGNVIVNFDIGVAVRSFQVHSRVLSSQSTFFAACIGAWSDMSSDQYAFLVRNVDDFYILEQQFVEAVPKNGHNIIENSNATGAENLNVLNATKPDITSTALILQVQEKEPIVALYREAFALLYGMAISTSVTTEISQALSHVEVMLQVCEQLGCVRLLYPYFNTVIVEQRQKVYIAIRLDAARWMRLAISLESTSIYTECLIHLAGAWPHWPWKTDRNTLPNELLKLVATKSKQIDDQCLEINQDLLLSTICVGRKGEPVTCAPEQMETWLLVQTFRDILASGIRNMNASNRRSLIQGKFYRRIHKGGEHYMSFEEVRCTCLDILPKGSWKELGSDLSDIKKYASVLVAPLAKNNLMIDPDAYNVGYLTCTEVYPSDVPWEQDVMEVA